MKCLFCRTEHRTEFYDELEEQIFACRARAARELLGLLEDFDPDALPSPRVEGVFVPLVTEDLDYEGP